MTTDYQEAINSAQARVQELEVELEAIRPSFVLAMEEFLAMWFDQEARNTAVLEGEHTRSLGSQLSAFKDEVEALAGRASEIVAVHYAGDQFWPHRKGHEWWVQHNGSFVPAPTFPPFTIFGHLGVILSTYGYLQSTEAAKRWRSVPEAPGMTWAQSITWEFPNPQPYRRYEELSKQFLAAHHELARALRAEVDDNARRLYDEA